MNRADHVTVPARGTSFFGREREREHLSALVRRAPLATLTGVGGAGKTRLATEIAAEAPGEVCWCELAALTRDEDVAPAVASALGRDRAGDATAAVVEALAGGELLLVLDNCEQVLEGVAALVEEVVRSVPGVRVLATSRAALGVEGEHVIALGPLADSEAVELFTDRARLVNWEFERTDANAAAIDAICRRLDGLPLAIELAAARTRSIPPEQIASHLERGLEVLERSRGPERHRTLYAAIDWSYRLLDEEERLAFERLSVVASSCDLEAAAAICSRDQVLGVLDRLAGHSLVRVTEDAGRARYAMLETLREYARERLRERGEEEAARDRHADHYAAVADRMRAEQAQGWSPSMLHEGIATFPEVRAACAWAVSRDESPARVARLLTPLWALAHSRHATEIGALCEEALGAWPEPGDDRIAILGVAATAHFAAGDPAAARARAAEALELGERPSVLALRALALVSYVFDAAPRETLERLDDVVASAREQGVPSVAVEMSVLAAQALAASGETGEALGLAETMRAHAEESGSPLMQAWSVYVLGTVLVASEPERAESCFREALELAGAGGYALVVGTSLRQLGRVAAAGGRSEEAAGLLAEAIERFADADDRPQLWDALRSAAPLLASEGRRETAAAVLAGAAADPRARAVPPLEAAETGALRAELEAELAAAPAERVSSLVPRVLEELRALAGEAAPPPAAPSSTANAFRSDGELWTLAFEGSAVHMPDLKGLHDIARLLATPDQDVHCLDLAGDGSAPAVRQGHAGEHLDEKARAAYKERLDELREEVELAQAANDTVRAERMREEIEAIGDALGAAFGLGGRARKAGDPAERARSAVTWRIRSALKRIEDAHPALGRHLRNSVSTGTYCAYRPERATDWQL